MPSLRSYLESRYNHLYSYVEPYGPDICTYCGDPSQSEDHVIPLAYLGSLGDFLEERLPELRQHLQIVPCCMNCNVMARDTLCKSIADKRAKIHQRIRHKHRNLLGRYDWQRDDMEELGPSLRQYIATQEHKRNWILARLAWPKRPHVVSFRGIYE